MEIIKLKPFYSEKIWGGNKLEEMGFDIPKNKKIGEAWIISAHENGMSFLDSGKFKNQSLKEVFENNSELFGNYPRGEFPILVKIITASDFLSVQVHPTDKYALKKHNSLGKPESWYILDAPKNAQLIYGHNAKTKEELINLVANNKWDKLLNKVNIEKGDFLYVAPGKIHAITPGVTVVEVQRSSDITYRFYDYDRLDDNGQARRLDIEDSIESTFVPDMNDFIVRNAHGNIFSSDFFSINIFENNPKNIGKFICPEDAYWLQITVIEGKGKINNINFKSGESAITLGKLESLNISGNLKIIFSWIKKQ